MDQNLYFRFIIPPWAGVIAALLVNWAVAYNNKSWVSNLYNQQGNNALLVLIVALLASPAAGFILNTVVVAFCHFFHRGPEHQQMFEDFRTRVLAIAENKMDNRMVNAMRQTEGAGIVAHFEYRADPPELLHWRRRQRAAFFVNCSTGLAIMTGMAIALICSQTPMARATIVCVILFAIVVLLSYNAVRSRVQADRQQNIWLHSLTDEDISTRLRRYAATDFGDKYKDPK